MLPKSEADRSLSKSRGFALIEVLLALAVLALVAGLILPRVPHEPGRGAMEAKAHEIAGLARRARNAAIRMRREVMFGWDPGRRALYSDEHSGRRNRSVEIPGSVDVMFVRPSDRTAGAGDAIRFFPGGQASGGAIAVRRGPIGYEVRVSALTGRVSVNVLSRR